MTLPYGRQSIDEDDVRAVTDALRDEFLTTGPGVARFESDLREVTGAPAVAALSSGTAALHAAYAAAGLGPGDVLLTTPITFAATATAALHLGAEVRFADVRDDTLTIDPGQVAQRLDSRTRLVAAVDYAGQPADLEPLLDVAHERGALLVEDASHAIGARYRERPVGAVADLTTFSFHPVKTVTTAEGGAVSGSEALVDRVRAFRNHGMMRDPSMLEWPDEGEWHQEVQLLGLNYRMSDVLAALGRSQLRKLPRFVERRAQLVHRYREALRDVAGIRLLHVAEDREAAWHLFAIRVLDGRRRRVFERLRAEGIGVQVHYLPVHLHPVFRQRGFSRGDFPVAEQAYEELLSLPLFPDMTDGDQESVLDALTRALAAA